VPIAFLCSGSDNIAFLGVSVLTQAVIVCPMLKGTITLLVTIIMHFISWYVILACY
jgi:hypothetical protein